MISWKYFKSVRKLQVKTWLKNAGVESYDDFVNVLKKLGVQAPSRSEVIDLFPLAVVKKDSVKAAPSVNKKVDPPKPVESKTDKATVEVEPIKNAVQTIHKAPVKSMIASKKRRSRRKSSEDESEVGE